jgi:serine/threonine protein kinase
MVALKLVMLPGPAADGDEDPVPEQDAILRYWQREMQVLAECQSETLACLTDWGPFVLECDGRYYMAYAEQFIAGDVLTEAAPLAVADSLSMVVDICEALRPLHSHRNRYIHRDVKPANVIRAERFVLIDPGIAFSAEETDITGFGCRPPGTFGYMSPEQCDYFRRRIDLDGRSDIFSLGLTLAFALTGRHAYAACPGIGPGPQQQQAAIVSRQWLPEFAPNLPPVTVPLLSRMLGLRPHQRYRSVDGLWAAAAQLREEVV